MNELPAWFTEFSNQQIKGIDDELKLLESKSFEELQITYLKVWSVIEMFSKIVVILSKKRDYLKGIEPEIKVMALQENSWVKA